MPRFHNAKDDDKTIMGTCSTNQGFFHSTSKNFSLDIDLTFILVGPTQMEKSCKGKTILLLLLLILLLLLLLGRLTFILASVCNAQLSFEDDMSLSLLKVKKCIN